MSNVQAPALQQVLVDSYTLMIKLHNYHWNVEGINFKPLHDLFEEQYTELFTAVDVIAERIRQLGPKVPASSRVFAATTSIKAGDENLSDKEMIKDLVVSHEAVLTSIDKALKLSQDAEDEPSVGLLVDRQSFHQKAVWFLSSMV